MEPPVIMPSWWMSLRSDLRGHKAHQNSISIQCPGPFICRSHFVLIIAIFFSLQTSCRTHIWLVEQPGYAVINAG